MEVFECIATKLDFREFSSKNVPASIKAKILEAARLTQSGNNSQHWRFILVEQPENLKMLAEDSMWGKWVDRANFAIVVLTDPQHGYHMIDAGRAVQDMELAAWGLGVGSCVFTGLSEERFRKDFNIPKNLNPTIIVGFGYPARRLAGKKSRKPLTELAFREKYGNKLN